MSTTTLIKLKVFRNELDVTMDTNFVVDGVYGWSPTINLSNEHTVYEFGIKPKAGWWQLFLYDPGLSSFCEYITSSVNLKKEPGKISIIFVTKPAINNELVIVFGLHHESIINFQLFDF